MTEVQRLQFEMLKTLDRVCRAHGLRYYLAYGTCIGAMRHKGFIPWDHDVDVLMPIDDARALEKYQDEFGDQLFVTSYRTDPAYGTISMRITDKAHPSVAVKNGKILEKGYAAMDIYPFYRCPRSTVALKCQIIRSHIYKILVGGPIKNHGKAANLISRGILFFYPQKNRKAAIARFERKMNYKGPYDEIADFYGLDISALSVIKYKKEWFGKPSELLFEGSRFYGPTDPDKYLTVRYGDYMTPPPRKEVEDEVRVELIQ